MSKAHSHSTLHQRLLQNRGLPPRRSSPLSPASLQCLEALRKTAPRRRAGSLHTAVQPAPAMPAGRGRQQSLAHGQCGWSHENKDLSPLPFHCGPDDPPANPVSDISTVFSISDDILALTQQRSCRESSPNSAAQLTLRSAFPQLLFSTSAAGPPLRGFTAASGSPWVRKETSALSHTIPCKGPEPLRMLVPARVLEPTPRRY